MTYDTYGITDVRGAVDSDFLWRMLTRVVASPVLFEETRGVLRVEYFHPHENAYATFWRAALDAYDRYGRLDHHTLYDEVAARVSEDLSFLPEEQELLLATDADEPGLVLWSTYHMRQFELSLDQGRAMVRRFLHERAVYNPLRRALSAPDGTVPLQLADMLSTAMTQLEQINSVDVHPVSSALPDDWRPQPLRVFSTGVEFLDRGMDGGHAPGEVNGLLGPYAGGKTTLMVQMAVAGAELEYRAAMEQGRTPRRTYIVTYEQSREEIRTKVISCAARIEFSTLREMTDPETQMSRRERNDYKPYELRRHREEHPDDQAPMPGEYDRFTAVRRWVGECIRIIDMSGGEGAKQGDGYLDELVAILQTEFRQSGVPPLQVSVDYTTLVAQRYMQKKGISEDKLRHYISAFVEGAKRKIAKQYNIPVWLLQQYNREANKKSSATLLSHTDAGESAAFAAALAFCVCLGNKDQATNCSAVNFSKRRRAGEPLPPTIVHIDGAVSTLVDVSARYRLDDKARKIVPVEIANQFQGQAAPRPTAAGPGRRTINPIAGIGF